MIETSQVKTKAVLSAWRTLQKQELYSSFLRKRNFNNERKYKYCINIFEQIKCF